ncbi:aldo/keto reductase [Chitinispirillales bacterium ANBcel5]|uniref:aldo/keto reductase n=1 Tax=Cellulosispirillum alkaliphilum TaxID=3039283 RepID=UPI002A51C14D|nr:aldo/keto reductase [Chitinispirillales bacterium ANBcel5]
MEKRRLGNSDMEITRIGLGAWAIGGSWQFGWGPQDDKESLNTILKAIEGGINWIDTAAVYGLGHSEEVVGKAIKQLGSQAPLIFTKCGLRWKENSSKRSAFPILKKESVREEIEGSLKRLDIETIDLYQIHWPRPPEDIEEAWSEMVKLKEEGKVRWIGVSNHNVEQMEKLNQIAPVTTLQPPYNLLNRSVEEEILPYCAEKNIGTIIYSPMASGLLSGKMTPERIKALPNDDWRKWSDNFKEPALSRNLTLVQKLSSIAKEKGVTTAEVAIAWTLKNPAVTAAIVGMRKPEQVNEVIGGSDFTLTDEDIKRIEG